MAQRIRQCEGHLNADGFRARHDRQAVQDRLKRGVLVLRGSGAVLSTIEKHLEKRLGLGQTDDLDRFIRGNVRQLLCDGDRAIRPTQVIDKTKTLGLLPAPDASLGDLVDRIDGEIAAFGYTAREIRIDVLKDFLDRRCCSGVKSP